MGRNSAGDSFLKGYFAHGTPEHFWVYAKTKNQAQVFANRLSEQTEKMMQSSSRGIIFLDLKVWELFFLQAQISKH